MLPAKAACHAMAFAVALLLSIPTMAARSAESVQRLVDTFAKEQIRDGRAVGLAAGVILPGQKPLFYVYGRANTATGALVTPDTLFEIASDTKVFTTNLLGQAVAANRVSLGTTLQQLSGQIGAVKPPSRAITLEELSDFTAGLPSQAPLCTASPVPGCLPSDRPKQVVYGAADFLAFFQNTVPSNYNVMPPAPLSSLPGPYQYSNFSIGLLGLILATPTGPIDESSVRAWYSLVRTQLLAPLGMADTFLTVPDSLPAARIAAGYALATATASVSAGKIVAIRVTDSGKGYGAPPAITIIGGGGSGAKGRASVKDGQLTDIAVTASGDDYLPPPRVALLGGGATAPASASAIVANGKIVGFDVISAGAGYINAPTVVVTGGRTEDGSDATARARIADGHVTALSLVDGGSGYLPPLTLAVAPGDGEHNVVPEWAAAGGLISSLRDMTGFAAAALGRKVVNTLKVPAAVASGFTIAETPYACADTDSSLANCPANAFRLGLAWQIQPADLDNGVPTVITKAGGLTGFTSQIVLVPRQKYAIVVLANSDAGGAASDLAYQITYGLLFPPK